MHKLDRSSVGKPACLENVPEEKRYSNLRKPEKDEIRDRLREMQRDRCAYCERRTGKNSDEGHIEHFRQQCDYVHLDLCWENMFWSCIDIYSCGKHKDDCDIKGGTGTKREFLIDHLIDPSIEDPDDFFLFVHDGTIQIRPDLDEANQLRASETLRVFNLAQSPYLRASREDAVRPYKDAIDDLIEHGEDIVKRYVTSQLAKIEVSPFQTAIRHYLGGLIQ